MIVWGGNDRFFGGGVPFGDRYVPALDLWQPINQVDAPINRYRGFTALWTGAEMIVWGGDIGAQVTDTGGRYDPANDTWHLTSTAGAPAPRADHAAVWTGSEMIVWGGNPADGGFETNTGGRYDPATDDWSPTTTVGAPPARSYVSGVWTGSEMIVWGGYGVFTDLDSGGRYDPSTNSWTATSTSGAPSPRIFHTAQWSGSEMLIWGGKTGGGQPTFFNSGGRYDPASDSWMPIPTTDAPSSRTWHADVWTGSELIIWGGCTGGTACTDELNSGAVYDPATDQWTATTTVSAPSARRHHSAVWTGDQMIVWGGSYTTTGGRYAFGPQQPVPARVIQLGPGPGGNSMLRSYKSDGAALYRAGG
jgi:N-acetylneuraminic acid mutarotase